MLEVVSLGEKTKSYLLLSDYIDDQQPLALITIPLRKSPRPLQLFVQFDVGSLAPVP